MAARSAHLASCAAALLACVTSDPVGSGGSTQSGSAGAPVSDDGGYSNEGGYSNVGGFPTEGGASSDGGSTSSTICGDGVCGIDETCENCGDDCTCSSTCGDGTCDATETCDTCEDDCAVCPMCGDGVCDATEDCDSCYQDCGVCPCVADSFEPNNGSPTASVVQHAVDYCDLSICGLEADWFEFSVTSSLTATITFFHAEGDLELEIYSGITSNYLSGSYSADDDESVTLTGLPAGTYWARVYGDMSENPDYCFRVD